MASLLDMIDDLDRKITKDGHIIYNHKILDILKINEKFFQSTRPKGTINNYILRFDRKRLVNTGVGLPRQRDALYVSIACRQTNQQDFKQVEEGQA
jgi:hypothetical protein